MRVPDGIKKCVAFIGFNSTSGFHYAGTVFFMFWPVPDFEDGNAGYAVTAKHVIDGIKNRSSDGHVIIRFNNKIGGVSFAATPIQDWVVSGDVGELKSDVAVFPLGPDLTNEYDILFLMADMYATNQLIIDKSIGVGDPVFITGLFVNHVGKNMNIPIVRVGNIAAMPEEPINTEIGNMDAYLIEARSIGGLSGSPVFVHLYGGRRNEKTNTIELGGDQFFFLGLIHGHWAVRPKGTIADNVSDEAVNMGIGIVVPFDSIKKVIELPQLVGMREETARRVKENLKNQSATSTHPSPSSPGTPQQ